MWSGFEMKSKYTNTIQISWADTVPMHFLSGYREKCTDGKNKKLCTQKNVKQKSQIVFGWLTQWAVGSGQMLLNKQIH